LQPDHHEMLYLKLADNADNVLLALKEADPDVLARLAEEHEVLVQDLHKTGILTDSHFLGRIQALNRQISEVISEIRQSQHEISSQIKQVADGKKLFHAYVT
jgi:hypothetical protein